METLALLLEQFKQENGEKSVALTPLHRELTCTDTVTLCPLRVLVDIGIYDPDGVYKTAVLLYVRNLRGQTHILDRYIYILTYIHSYIYI